MYQVSDLPSGPIPEHRKQTLSGSPSPPHQYPPVNIMIHAAKRLQFLELFTAFLKHL